MALLHMSLLKLVRRPASWVVFLVLIVLIVSIFLALTATAPAPAATPAAGWGERG